MENDVTTNDCIHRDRIGENRLIYPNQAHRWYYISAQEEDDFLVFRNVDSEGRLPCTSSAFKPLRLHSLMPFCSLFPWCVLQPIRERRAENEYRRPCASFSIIGYPDHISSLYAVEKDGRGAMKCHSLTLLARSRLQLRESCDGYLLIHFRFHWFHVPTLAMCLRSVLARAVKCGWLQAVQCIVTNGFVTNNNRVIQPTSRHSRNPIGAWVVQRRPAYYAPHITPGSTWSLVSTENIVPQANGQIFADLPHRKAHLIHVVAPLP